MGVRQSVHSTGMVQSTDATDIVYWWGCLTLEGATSTLVPHITAGGAEHQPGSHRSGRGGRGYWHCRSVNKRESVLIDTARVNKRESVLIDTASAQCQ